MYSALSQTHNYPVLNFLEKQTWVDLSLSCKSHPFLLPPSQKTDEFLGHFTFLSHYRFITHTRITWNQVFLTALLRYNLHAIKSTLLKCATAFSICRLVQPSLLLTLEYLHHQKTKTYLWAGPFSRPHPQPFAITHQSTFCLLGFTCFGHLI